MIGYKLTTEQKNAIQGQFYNDNCFFNCVQDINNDWFLFLSNDDIIQINNTEFDFLISLPEFEYIPPIIVNLFI
ncbi:hypothetical protein UFOVP104_9 [uncultured Caudovirales phage]|uniref:Uncharacterized protein n=1 Tax=uncultured Caudovirales phage TaxID=2100421 RepID=A0A6J5L403_9CAUD|nr:hypothetical protein UFOVP104_9 [uncultured Caudovirales phage]CAB4134316.1 hypothetical protein UFOVP271_44 [uncultured Caudovirales phage]